MRIKAILALTSRVSIAIVSVIAVATVITGLGTRKVDANLALAVDIRAVLFHRVFLRDEYYLHHEERSLAQVRTKTQKLAELLAKARLAFIESEPGRILDEMLLTDESLVKLFELLVSHAQANPGGEAAGIANREYETRLLGQILVKSYILQDDARMIEEWFLSRLASLKAMHTLLFSLSLTSLIVLVIANSLWISRKLTHGIERLQSGMARIGSGDLASRLSVFPNDEISDVAKEINRMASSLAASFTSIQNLESEASQRKRPRMKFAASMPNSRSG